MDIRLENINSENFEEKAIEVFEFQRKSNPIYAAYCQSIQKSEVDQLKEIPFLPISFFKTHKVSCLLDSDLSYFESSGTSGQVNAKHYYKDLSLYHQSIELSYCHFFGDKKYTIVGLLPHYLERKHSSLVAMVRHWMQINEQEEYFYLGVGKPDREVIPNFFKGHIDSFAYFNKVLNNDEIVELANNEIYSLRRDFGDYKSSKSLMYYYDANHIKKYKILLYKRIRSNKINKSFI